MMKPILYSLLILFAIGKLFGQPLAWKWITPFPQGNFIFDSEVHMGKVYFLTNYSGLLTTNIQSTYWNLNYYENPRFYRNAFGNGKIITSTEDALFIAGRYGLYSSTDIGRSWQRIDTVPNNGLDHYYYGQEIIFAEGGFGLLSCCYGWYYKTTNSGAFWYWIQSFDNREYDVKFFTLGPENSWAISNKYIGTNVYEAHIKHSENSGWSYTWYEQSVPLNYSEDTTYVLENIYFISSGLGFASGYYKSIQSNSVNYFLLRTTDFGSTWNRFEIEFRPLSIVSINENDWIISADNYTGWGTQIYKSGDAGLSWNLVYQKSGQSVLVTIAKISEDVLIAGGLAGFLLKSIDGGNHWEEITEYHRMSEGKFFVKEDSIFGMAIGMNGKYYISTDLGNNWELKTVPFPFNNSDLTCMTGTYDEIWILTSGNDILSTKDRGNTWTKINLPLNTLNCTNVEIIDILLLNREIKLIVFRSSCNGTIKNYLTIREEDHLPWQLVELSDIHHPRSISARNLKKIFIAGSYNPSGGSSSNGYISFSTDKGVHWWNNYFSSPFHKVLMKNDKIIFAGSNALYRSQDGGINFYNVYNRTPSPVLEDIYFENQNLGWAIYGDILKTTNGGYTWVPSDFQLPLDYGGENVFSNYSGMLYILGGNGEFIYAEHPDTAYGGYFEEDPDEDPLPDDSTQIPVYYKLQQNFPNPFNFKTTIKYIIPKLSFITLNVYDVLGKEVAVLVNEEKPAGRYEVEFSAIGGPASGIYFYQLHAGDFVQIRKMLLLK